jgi:hypothetical protein
MPRYVRNTVILAKVEATPGTDAVPTGAADAVLVFDPSFTPLEAQNVNRELVRGYFGASEELVATAYKRLAYATEMAGSAAAATAPQWGDLLLACAFAEALLGSPSRVEYTPVSDALKTLTHYWHDSGVRHIADYCMGNAKMEAMVGGRAMLLWDFIGRDGGISAVANATPTYTNWKVPVGLAKVNVVDITLGCTYSAGALSGGTVYPSTGLKLDLGNQVDYTALLSSDGVDISDRKVSGHMALDLTPAQEVTIMATVKANTTQGLGITIGLAAGNKIIIHAPAVQIINPTYGELNGRRLCEYDLRLVPTAAGSGNDELRIVTQ